MKKSHLTRIGGMDRINTVGSLKRGEAVGLDEEDLYE
jgi:hypothetical protein